LGGVQQCHVNGLLLLTMSILYNSIYNNDVIVVQIQDVIGQGYDEFNSVVALFPEY
jgi:hypothetical protein